MKSALQWRLKCKLHAWVRWRWPCNWSSVLCSARCLWQIPTIYPHGKPDCADRDPYPVSSWELWQCSAWELWTNAEGEMVSRPSFIPSSTRIQGFFVQNLFLQWKNISSDLLQNIKAFRVPFRSAVVNSTDSSEPEHWCAWRWALQINADPHQVLFWVP